MISAVNLMIESHGAIYCVATSTITAELTERIHTHHGTCMIGSLLTNQVDLFPQLVPLLEKAAAGLTAGGLAAIVGSPADLSLIRMQSDSTLPAASRRNYKHVGDAMTRWERNQV